MHAVHIEPGEPADEVQAALDAELAEMARWLGLPQIDRPDRAAA